MVKDKILFIRKRDGREVPFDQAKITEAIFKAAQAIGGDDRQLAEMLAGKVVDYLKGKFDDADFGVEDVQDAVEKVLIEDGHAKTAKAFILYRNQRTRIREGESELVETIAKIIREADKSNANITNGPSAKMLQVASAAMKSFNLRHVLPEEMSEAHRAGDMHIHDLDFYGTCPNCIQIPLAKLLTNGFNNGHGFIRSPKRPASAAALAAIVLQSSQNDMYGGQSFAAFDRDMAPFFAKASEEEAFQASESLVFNLNSMHSRAGAQVPFSSLNLGADTSPAGRMVTRNILLAHEKGLGHGESPIFPNIIFRVKKGVNLNPGDPNYDLLKLAIRVAARRMNPTFSFMDSSFNAPYGDQVAYMGCRTRVMANRKGSEISDGRGNLSFTTINLPRLALKAKGNVSRFMEDLARKEDLAIRQLYHRYRTQCNIRVRDIPFVFGQGLYLGSEGLKPDDTIEQAIQHGTLSVGFVGLAEALILLTGRHHGQDAASDRLGHEIVAHLRKACDQAADAYDLNYTLIATPAEQVAGRFHNLDLAEFGEIEGVTGKGYYTNSFHVPVSFPIAAFDKIRIEGAYHKYCNAGHISYVEFDAPPIHNLGAVESIIRHFAASDAGYAGVNFPLDYCESCTFLGTIHGDTCPVCGQSAIRRVRRITGYLSTVDRFNDAKVCELKQRVNHHNM